MYSVITGCGINVIESLGNKIAREIWEKDFSRSLPKEMHIRAKALLTIMYNTDRLEDLKIKGEPPKIRLHKLKGDRKYEWSVTIKLPWCITFEFKNGKFLNVKIENYHEG